jgi:hypothetical protein
LTATQPERRLVPIRKTNYITRLRLGSLSAEASTSSQFWQKEFDMKKLTVASVTLALLMSTLALAQYDTKPDDSNQAKAAKAVSLSGKISDDGKTFTSDKDKKSWTVANPEALKGHEGHEVTLKVHADAAKNEIHVVSVKMGKEMKDTMKKDEMQK